MLKVCPSFYRIFILLWAYCSLTVASDSDSIQGEYKNNKPKKCERILSDITSVKHFPLYPIKKNRPGEVIPGHGILVETRREGDLVVEIARVTGATLPGSLTRAGSKLILNHEGRFKESTERMSADTAEKKNEIALQELDSHNQTVAQFAIKSEAAGSKKPGQEGKSKYTKEVLESLAQIAVKNWDATQFSVKKDGKVVGSGRIFSSGIDRRVAAYPEFIKEFLKSYKGKWRVGLVDAFLTRPLVIEDILKTELERPILDIPEGLKLPNGKTIYFLVGEAKEIGAFAIPEDLPDRSVYRSVLQSMFRAAFESEFPAGYKQHGQIFYGAANADLIDYWRKMGWEDNGDGKPFLKPADEPGKFEAYWVVKRTSDSFDKWLTEVAQKPGFEKKQEQNARKLLIGLSDPGLTERQSEIWRKYYVSRMTEEEIAKELEISKSAVHITLNNANDKIEIQMGVRPPPSPIRLEDIIASANTPEKVLKLNKAIAKARKNLTRLQQDALDLKLAGLRNFEMTDKLGINNSNVGVRLGIVQREIESALGNAFPIELRPMEFIYIKLLSAMRDPVSGEPQEITELRKKIYHADLEEGEIKTINQLRMGMSINEIADSRGVDFVAAGVVLRHIREKVEKTSLTDKKPSIWRRVLEPEEKEKLNKALSRVLEKATKRQRDIWIDYEKGNSGMQIARDLKVSDGPITKTIRKIKAKVEIELGERFDTAKYSIARIEEAADTPEKERRLKAIIKDAEEQLTAREKQFWKRYYKKNQSTFELEKAGFDTSYMSETLNKMKKFILENLGDEFDVKETNWKGTFAPLFDALRTEPQNGEPPAVTTQRKAIHELAFQRVQLRILEGIRDGIALEEIGKKLRIDIRANLYAINTKINDHLRKGDQKLRHEWKPWERLLNEVEKEKLETATRLGWPKLTSFQKKVWKKYIEDIKSIPEIAEELDSTFNKVLGAVAKVKYVIERKWPSEIADGNGKPWGKVLIPSEQERLDQAVRDVTLVLDDRQKDIVKYFYWKKMLGSEIAPIMKMSPAMVNHQIRRIKKWVEEELER